MRMADVGQRLKSIRERVYGLREMARLIGWEPSKYQYYESGVRKEYLPHDFVEIIRPHLVGRGDPIVTDAELDGLLPPSPSRGASPIEARLDRIEALLTKLLAAQRPIDHPDPITGEWLDKALKERGKSQKGLAKAMGRDDPAISRIISGERQIKAAEVPVILAYLREPEGSS